MLNNKGQSLILFIIMFPIILLILIITIDLGRIYTRKLELDNINKLTLNYGLDKLEEPTLKDEMLNLINLNTKEIDKIDIKIENNKLYIHINDSVDGLFSNIINIKTFKIESSYIGYFEGNTKRIERV